MKIEYYLYKKNIKRIILLLILLIIISLCTSKVFASTIDNSNISVNIDANGVCHIQELLDITAIDDPSDYSTKYFMGSNIQLKRGRNIEKLNINNSEISKSDIDDYYDDYVGIIKLDYTKTRKVSIFIIIHKKRNNNFL